MASQTSPSYPSVSDPPGSGWARAVVVWAPVLIAAYVATIFLLWVLPPTSLAVDETEQMVNSQVWAWGYGGQPPLYTWLQILVFEITGPGKMGLSILKYSLILAIYLGMWRLARQIGLGRWSAAIAMAGLLTLPTLVWSVQRDLTHSVLLAALCIWTMSAALWAMYSGKFWAYALLGVGFAAGLLSKWNFALLIVGLLGAAALLRQGRPLGWAMTLAIFAALLMGPTYWMIANPDLSLSTTGRLGVDGGPGIAAALRGSATLLEGLASELLVLTLISAWAFGALLWRRGRPARREERFLAVTLAISSGVLVVGMLGTGTQEVNPRWLLPITLFLPLLVALRVDAGLSAKRGSRFLAGTIGLAFVFGLAAPQAILWASPEAPSRMAPYAAAGDILMAHNVETALAPNMTQAGNLRAFAPETAVIPLNWALADRLPAASHAVWASPDHPMQTPPEALVRVIEATTGRPFDPTEVEVHALPFPAPYAEQTFFFHIAEIAP